MNKPKRIIRTSSLKRRSAVPPSAKVHLEKVLGFTIQNNACIDTSIDGTLAYPAGCVVVLYNAKKTKQSHIYNVSKKTITCVAFSGDGKHLVTGESGHQPAVRVWELETNTQTAEFHGHKFGISCVAFSPNLKYLISVGTQHDMTANVWNWKANCKIASNKVTSKVADVAFSEDGSYFVTVGIRHVKFWYLDSTKSRINETVPLMGRAALLGEHKNNVFVGVVCGRGECASSTFTITRNGLLCEFNAKRSMDKWVELRTSSASCLAVTSTHIYIGCADGIVRVFSSGTLHYITSLPRPHFLGVDVAAGQDPRHMMSPPKDAKYPDTVAISYDTVQHKVTCVYKDHSMYVWDVQDIKRVGKSKSFLYHSSSIWGLEVYPKVADGPTLPDGTFITCGSDDTIRMWNINQGLSMDTYYKRNIYSYELLKIIYTDPDLQFLCEKENLSSGKNDKTDNAHLDKNGIRSVRVSPEGRHLASGDRTGNIRVHDLRTCAEENFMEAHDSEVLCLEFTDPALGVNLMASSGRDRLLHVFDREQDYGLIQTLDDHSAAVTAVKFAQQDSELHMISCGVDKSILFRNAVAEPNFQFVLNRHLVLRSTLYDMTVDPSYKFVATACQDRNVRIYNMKNGKQKTCYSGSAGSDGTLLRIELDSSGSLVATSCSDKNLCILDFFTGEMLATMFGHSEVVTGVKFSNDMRHLISVSGDGCIFIWRLPHDFTEDINSRRMKLADPTVVTNGELVNNSSRRGTFMIPKSTPNLAAMASTDASARDSTDLGGSQALLDNNANMPPEPDKLDYRFSIGALPSWAKKQVLQEPLKPPPNMAGPSAPAGVWAKNIGSAGSVPIKSTMDDSTIQLSLADCMGTPNTQRKDKRRFTVEPDSLAKQIRQMDESRRQVSVITDDDVNNRDDTDDDEFHTLTAEELEEELNEGDAEGSEHDTSRVNMFRGGLMTRKDSQFDFDAGEEAESGDVIYMENNEMESPSALTSSFQVFAGEMHSARDMSSEGTDVPSLDDVTDDENDVSTPDHSKLVSTPDQEKFLHDNFLKMDILEQNTSTPIASHRHSISAKFLTNGQQARLRQQAAAMGSGNRNSKKKEEMGKAIDESRKKLQALGWKGSCDIKLLMGRPQQLSLPKKETTPTSARRSSGQTNRRRPEPGSDRRKTIGETFTRTAEYFSSPSASPRPRTPERRRWGGGGGVVDSHPPNSPTLKSSSGAHPNHASNPNSPMRKWASMLDMGGGGGGVPGSPGSRGGGGGVAGSRVPPRSRTPTTTYRSGVSGHRTLPRVPASGSPLANKAENFGGPLRKTSNSRSEKNILAAMENVDASEKRRSLNLSDKTPSYMKQTSSSTSKLARARSGNNLVTKEENSSRSSSPRPPSRTGNINSERSSGAQQAPVAPATTSSSVASKAAAARRSGAARRERLNAGMKSKFKSSPSLVDKNLSVPDNQGVDDLSGDVNIDGNKRHVGDGGGGRLSMPASPRVASPPTKPFADNNEDEEEEEGIDVSPDDEEIPSKELQDRLAMPPPPTIPPPSNIHNPHAFDNHPDSHDVNSAKPVPSHVSNTALKFMANREAALSGVDIVNSPRSAGGGRVAASAAMMNKIIQANTPPRSHPISSAATERTISEINEIAKATSVGISPWHSTRSNAASGQQGSNVGDKDHNFTTSSRSELTRSDSSNSLDETPVKEEKKSKNMVTLTNIGLSCPAPPPLPSQPPPPSLSSQPPPTTTSNLTEPAVPTSPSPQAVSGEIAPVPPLQPQTPPKPTSDTWARPRGASLQSTLLPTHDGEPQTKPTPEHRYNLRRREGEPEESQDRNRKFSANALLGNIPASSSTADSAYKSQFARPRSSLDSAMNSSGSTTGDVSPRPEIEGRVRTGTLLSRNKELLTNLLTTNREQLSASPQVPRRSRGGNSSNSSSTIIPTNTEPAVAAIKQQWMKQKFDKHPLDLTASSSASSLASSSSASMTSPRTNILTSTTSSASVSNNLTSAASNSSVSSYLSSSQTVVMTTTANTVPAQQQNGTEVSSPEIGSSSSAFRRTSGPTTAPRRPVNGEATSQSPPVKDSPRQSEESPRTDRSSLKLELQKINQPTSSPEDIKLVLAGLKDHTEKLAALLSEYPELLKPNLKAGKEAIEKLQSAFGLEPVTSTSSESQEHISSQLMQQFSFKVCQLMDKQIYERVDQRVADLLEKQTPNRNS